LTIIDIDGRGKDSKEALQDMWDRMAPLEAEGYQVISTIDVVDTKTNQVVESFQVTDPTWTALKAQVKSAAAKNPSHEHRPPTPHEFPFKARVKLQR
jgi:hypothetical protein